jgi:Fur family transcriptional regulator, ferric uptake regulator
MARPTDHPAASPREPARWHERLRRESCKLTGPRRAILRVLGGQLRPLSSQEVFRRLPKGEGDLATVYRSIQLLERLGMVKRFHFGDGVARFALLDESRHGHQHHLVCTRCSSMVEIGDCIVRELEERIAARSKFKAVTHRLEFFGVCPACQ